MWSFSSTLITCSSFRARTSAGSAGFIHVRLETGIGGGGGGWGWQWPWFPGFQMQLACVHSPGLVMFLQDCGGGGGGGGGGTQFPGQVGEIPPWHFHMHGCQLGVDVQAVLLSRAEHGAAPITLETELELGLGWLGAVLR